MTEESMPRFQRGRVKQIEDKLTAHFLGEGCFGEKLEVAFRNLPNRAAELSQKLEIPLRELLDFGWWMVRFMNQTARRETAATLAELCHSKRR